ncbi:GtrA family protein [Cryomorphaceae bacterium 1068]|nr:GtrA family protein [Cryomorphaceae bacterium 1068]
MSEVIRKFIKFGIVGVSGVFVDFLLTYLCKEKLHLNKYVSNSIGFITAATSNYWLNRIWSFESVNSDISTECLSFIGVGLVGLLINNSVLWFINEKVGLNFYMAKLLAIAVTTIWNFGMSYYFIF